MPDTTLVAIGPVLALGLFAGVLVFVELGRRTRLRRAADEGAAAGLGVVEGAIFGMVGLLIAFTFSGAADRFAHRRVLVTEEANAIGTAWLRIDLVADEAQPALRELFRRYLDSRLATYKHGPDVPAALAEWARSNELQQEIWAASVAAATDPRARTGAPMVLLSALNEMIDITTTRLMATRNHPPSVIYVMLAAFTLAGAFLAGYAMAGRSRNWTHAVAFAAVMATTFYVILDIEYPRLGFIRVDAADEVLVELRRQME